MFAQKLEVPMSSEFKLGWQSPAGPSLTMEFIPKNEKVETWTQMISVMGIQGLAAKKSADEAYAIEAASIQKACPNNFVDQKISYRSPQGYPTASGIIGCSKHPQIKNKNEVAFYLFIKGKADFYIIKKAFREDLSAPKLDKLSYQALAKEVLSVKICKNNGQSPVCELEKWN